MKFAKLQGAGNDFILIHAEGVEHNWSRLAKAMCHRHFGVGADGLLLLLPSSIADLRMRMFNPDGSEAEACGNGLRCLAKYAVDSGLLPQRFGTSSFREQIKVETSAGVRTVKFHQMGEATKIQTSMGAPKFGANDIPVRIEPGQGRVVNIKQMLSYPVTVDGEELRLNLVSMGNPHAVCFWQGSVDNFPLMHLGPKVEHLAIFPNRVNFEVANVVSRQCIETRVWERGAGETLACGTGTCAVAVAAQLHGLVDKEVDIKVAGGVLQVLWDGVGEVYLGGPAETVFTGEWKLEEQLR